MGTYYLIILLILPSTLSGMRFFRNGRLGGGSLRASSEGVDAPSVVEERWFEQQLDHFSPTDLRTWQQRYQVNDQYYTANNGSVFLRIGGELEAPIKWLTDGSWIEYAQKHNALLLQIEHRFYGKSRPTEDLSVENLRYLTSQQALADISAFISGINEQYGIEPSRTKWIAFGGSYAGSLAAWLRLKYPHLVQGAVSSSPPLLAQVDFDKYLVTVSNALQGHSADCELAVRQGVDQIKALLQQESGQENLNTLFDLCDPIEDSLNNTKDISNLFQSIADNFAMIVQYNKDNISPTSTIKNITIDTVCSLMVNQSIGTPVDRLAAVNNMIVYASYDDCFNYRYDKFVTDMRNVSYDCNAGIGDRQWTYQTCTEFGFFPTSSAEPHTFGTDFPVDFFIDQCRDIYGEAFNKTFLQYAVNRTNAFYGGLDIQVSNVVFVQGSIDPWQNLGIIQTASEEAPVIYINGTAHCAELYSPSDEDSPELVAARQQIGQLIDSWLAS